VGVNRLWQDAAGLLQSAAAAPEAERADIAILIDDLDGLRVVEACGWSLEALRREYRAVRAFAIEKSAGGVVVQAQSDSASCHLSAGTSSKAFLQRMSSTVPHHLVYA
jgi:hypothetical protein